VIAMPSAATFAIGVLSDRSGANIETVRYYERAGLLATLAQAVPPKPSPKPPAMP
jgi:hypothetical protein